MANIDDNDLLNELENRFNQNKRSLEELQELTSQLKTVNKKLEESEALKSHFLSNIRNEIINPFTSILNLSKQITTLKDNEISKAIIAAKLIHSEAFALDFQLKNIFAAAELEAGDTIPQIYDVNLNSVIQGLIDLYQDIINDKKLKIIFSSKIEKSVTFKTDPAKFTVILSNILNNAITFSKEDNKIEFNLGIENNNVVVSIKDYGIGIDSEKQAIIFDRFKRIDSAINTINKGYGLGLSVAKALIDVLSGTITISSKPNEGSIFTVFIPEANTDIESNGVAFDENEMLF